MVFIEDVWFQRRRQGRLDDDELFGFMEWLAVHPDAGKIIRGSGGLRKVRWSSGSHGKRGGVRIIYFWWITDSKILLLDVYGKSRQEDLSADEIKRLKRKIVI